MTAFIERREVITLLGSAAAWPLAARAQQSAMPVIGYLSGATFEMTREYVAAFHQGLADTGFAKGCRAASAHGRCWHKSEVPERINDVRSCE